MEEGLSHKENNGNRILLSKIEVIKLNLLINSLLITD
jgi:hypothetical protein